MDGVVSEFDEEADRVTLWLSDMAYDSYRNIFAPKVDIRLDHSLYEVSTKTTF